MMRDLSTSGGQRRSVSARVLLLALLLAASPGPGSAEGPAAGVAAAPSKAAFKIGLMTGTVSQGEDEFRGALMMIDRYPGLIKHVTYPDNFMQEQETTVSQITGLAADPAVKVIILAQAVPGSMAAIQKIRATRPEMKFILIEPHEDVDQINAVADVALNTDQLRRGENLILLAKQMGADTFVHYSFPRHMSQELLARRREKMEEVAGREGVKFVSVSAPDPMGEGGLPATQQFVLEDVPRQVSMLGPKTAFFSTNCGMQEPLILSVLEAGGIFPEQCCPSPTHGYPGALGLAIPQEKAGDMKFITQEIARAIEERGAGGRFATWPVPFTIMAIEGSVELAKDWLDGGKADLYSKEDMRKYLQTAGGGIEVEVDLLVPDSGRFYNVLCKSVVF